MPISGKLKGHEKQLMAWVRDRRSDVWIAQQLNELHQIDVSHQAVNQWRHRNVRTWHKFRNSQRRAKRLQRAANALYTKEEK